MKTLILELPGLLDVEHAKDVSQVIESLSLPILTQILSKADCLSEKQFIATSLSKLERQGTINPRWAVEYLKLADTKTSYKYWFRADPVELQSDINAVYLKGNRHITLGEHGLEQTRQYLQDCFEEEDAKFFMVSAQEAYIGCNQHHRVEFVAPLTSLGNNQLNALPSGKDAPFWNNRLVEIQMSLFDTAAPSTMRSATAPINSVYFWGDPAAILPELNLDRVISNSNLLLGVAAANKIEANRLADLSMDEIIRFFSENNKIQIVDMELLWLRKQALTLAWLEKIKQLEENSLPKIIQALKQKQLDELWIITGAKNCFRLRASHLNKFWKRQKNISNFLN